MSDGSTLLRVTVVRDYNDDGERAYLVTPLYRLSSGRLVTVPDSRGWPTLGEALAEVERIGGGVLAAE
jgi:hypothetical protein